MDLMSGGEDARTTDFNFDNESAMIISRRGKGYSFADASQSGIEDGGVDEGGGRDMDLIDLADLLSVSRLKRQDQEMVMDAIQDSL